MTKLSPYIITKAGSLACALWLVNTGLSAQANDIKNAINKVESKLGINSGATIPGTTTPAINGGSSSIKSLLQQAVQKAGDNQQIQPGAGPATTATSGSSSSIKSLLQQAVNKVEQKGSPALPATTTPSVPILPGSQKPQSVKVKVEKELLRQVTKYGTKHPNKLLNQGVKALNKAIEKQ